MTLEKKILRDLAAGQSTAGALGEKLKLPAPLLEAILDRLVREGLVTTGSIMNRITVYRLDSMP